ncbi:sensor domain-containing phosphodiesterase [Saccharobesus litoralis]|uniref:sensor domain-containing phosphodiesterase n=1 Tax=Saccharobesus litoralis TaxID=2172099 RepID=UPI00131F458B|nr:EAL domain-containing protein [Saccharobesus litoralis]
MQDALMAVSELASNVTDLNQFYPQAHQVVAELMSVPNFYIVFQDKPQKKVKLAYFFDEFGEDEGEFLLVSSLFEYGLTGWVLRNGVPLLCNPENKRQMLESGQITQIGKASHSWLGVPLIRQGQTIGVLVIQSYSESITFSPRDTNVMQFVADHIVHAIERVQQKRVLELEIEKRTHELTRANNELTAEIHQRERYEQIQNALIEISELSCTGQSIEGFYHAVHHLLSRLVYAENFYIALIAKNGQDLTFPYFVDTYKISIEPRPLGRGLTEYVLRTAETQLFDLERILILNARDQISIPESEISRMRDQGFSAWLGAPLTIDNEVRGVIVVQSYQPKISYFKQDIDLLRYASNHIALALNRLLSQQALTRSNEELERIVTARTEALYNVNQDLFQQIEERKKIEAKLYHEALHDALTGLPNRAYFNQALSDTIKHWQQDSTAHYFVLFIDLDRFKVINDTFGHNVGDEFLVKVSRRVAQNVRNEDMLARLGGDEFVILLHSANSLAEAELIGKSIVESLSQPFMIQGNELYAGSSIGLTGSDYGYTTTTAVLRDADAAMYEAKLRGRGRCVVFDADLHQALIDKLTLETELRRALNRNEIDFVYQPIFDLHSHDIMAIEVLARWDHPTRGYLVPDDFMELAEETGVIFDIDILALQAAFRLLKDHQFATTPYVAINISGRSAHNNSQRKAIMALINQSGVDKRKLVLEFSESSLTTYELSSQMLQAFHGLGVKLALDDIGAESGSLKLLFSAPIDYVKIDRTIVGQMDHSERIRDFIEVLCQIGRKAGFFTIAEGIRTAAQKAQLTHFGCQYGQGEIFQLPVPLPDIKIKS